VELSLAQVAALLLAFALVALASNDIGHWFARWKLPLISGFLFTGVLAGPYVLDLLTEEATTGLGFVDQVSLAVIAFAAGAELYLKEMRARLRSILFSTAGIVVVTFSVGVVALLLLADHTSFMASLGTTGRIAVALLAAAILVARSPSSAIAIVNELRARGPFTQTTLGVTVLMDVAVIVLFAISFSIADSLLTGRAFDVFALVILLGELVASVGLGAALGWLMGQLLVRVELAVVVRGAVLVVGYGVFVGCHELRELSHDHLPVSIHLEPLLICMVAAFTITNFTEARERLTRVLRAITPLVFVAFFTLTGASLELDVMLQTWPIALALFALRLGAIAVGAWTGGRLAGDEPRYCRIAWMTYLTQAGVALGLAKNVAVAFPDWGPAFATTLIALIVFNQLVGPPFFKWAIFKVGEENLRAEPAPFDGVRDAVIFGVEGQSLALARVLASNGWQVKLADVQVSRDRAMGDMDVFVHHVDDFELATLESLHADRADAIVCLLTDEQNLHICQLAFENFGTRVLVARIDDRRTMPAYQELGVLVVDPKIAMISLLDRSVRSPAMTSILLGMDEATDMVDVELGNEALSGFAVKELRLPLDVAVLYVHRDGSTRSCQATTVLEVGDLVTLSGPPEEVEKAVMKLEA